MDKYDATIIEPKWQEFWDEKQIFAFDSQSNKPLFVVDTPPPYVSADHLHAGHIMSYTQAEFIVRYKRMRGFNVYYPMGFDDNGLPTERFVEKKYNIDKSKITRSEFIELCLKETASGAKTYRELWNRLGVSIDWKHTYSTISPLASKISQWSLLDLHKKGALYRKAEPILWCVTCETALAQADLEHDDKTGTLNSIEFAPGLTIATTRPELLPACVALYINPDDTRYNQRLGEMVTVPLIGHQVPIKASAKVDPAFGTGLMMVCTWGDQEDVEKWKADNLEERILFTENGKLNELGGKYAGLTILEARHAILADLQAAGYLKEQKLVEQVVNVHERCGTPVEFILSKQWFIQVAELKDTWLEYGKKLNWYPESRRRDYEIWVENLKWDWCISRQRFYGVPLPIWYCAKCEEPIFAREEDLPVNPLEDKAPVDTCPKCGVSEIIPEKDVLDTWATSSVTPLIIQALASDTPLKDQLFPATVRPNAFEIIRTWDFYAIIKSHYHFGDVPFRDLMISGHGLDEQGRKFSKRLGNYVPARELVEQHSADAIRYWATGAMLGQNLRFSQSEVDMGRKTTVKLWNVGRFLSRFLEGKNSATNNTVAYEAVDLWIIDQLNDTIRQVTEGFESYSYLKARDALEDFFWSRFADYYIECVKYRLYGEDEQSKAAAIHTLYTVFLAILKLYAPILPFVTEEVYQEHFRTHEPAVSIHASDWPEEIKTASTLDIADFASAIQAIDEVRKYKSENGLSLGKELDEYTLETALNMAKYGEFVAKVIRVKELKTK